jgi:transcription termination/antitermination protein NusA
MARIDSSTQPGVYFGQLNGRSATWVTPTFFFGPVVAWHSAWKEAIVSRDFVGALLQLNAEKQVSREQLIGAVEDGIQSAYRRVAGDEDIQVRIDAESGRIRVYRARLVVEEIEDELTQITVEDARKFDANAKPGDVVETEQLDGDVFGRIGAQTAKQIVLQRIREVERDQVFDQFASREGELITGTVNRVEPRAIILDVGKNTEAILATTEQSALEHYRIGQNVKAFVLEVRRSVRGPQIFVSRTHKGFLRRLFELEVPEIHNGTVEIKAIAREAGSRSKVGVSSRQDGLDPVGATVGQRGARVQAVVAELAGEKIDVIPWNEDPALFVANALSPAQVLSVDIDEEKRIASVTVPERMLSLAIGREGQNARLAARLTGWRIDIRSDVSVAEAKAAAEAEVQQPVTAEAAAATADAVPSDAPPAGEPAPAKPKRTTKKAAAAAESEATEGAAAEAPAKPKRATKKAAAATEATDGAAAEPPAKPKRATKKVAAASEPAEEPAAEAPESPAAEAPPAEVTS